MTTHSARFEQLRQQQLLHRQRIAELEQAEARIHARKTAEYAGLSSVTEQIGELSGSIKGVELSFASLQAEFAAELRVSDLTIARRMSAASALMEFPRVVASLEAGAISKGHSHVIASAGDIVDPHRRDEYEQLVNEYAETNSVNRTKAHAKRVAERLTSRTLDERHEQAMMKRGVFVRDLSDGMAELCIVTAAPLAHAMRDRITRISKAVQHEKDPRKRQNIAADVATDLLLTSDPTAHGSGAVSATIQLVMPALSLLPQTEAESLRNHPVAQRIAGLHGTAEMPGYGPISTELAKLITADADHWEQVNIAPATAQVLTVERYRPSDAQRRFIRGRDIHCRFPGCIRSVCNNELDHTIEAANGGATSTQNLGFLCSLHHTLKHHQLHEWFRWRVTQQDDGVMKWITPTGDQHIDEPISLVMFQPVPVMTDRGDPDSDEPAPF